MVNTITLVDNGKSFVFAQSASLDDAFLKKLTHVYKQVTDNAVLYSLSTDSKTTLDDVKEVTSQFKNIQEYFSTYPDKNINDLVYGVLTNDIIKFLKHRSEHAKYLEFIKYINHGYGGEPLSVLGNTSGVKSSPPTIAPIAPIAHTVTGYDTNVGAYVMLDDTVRKIEDNTMTDYDGYCPALCHAGLATAFENRQSGGLCNVLYNKKYNISLVFVVSADYDTDFFVKLCSILSDDFVHHSLDGRLDTVERFHKQTFGSYDDFVKCYSTWEFTVPIPLSVKERTLEYLKDSYEVSPNELNIDEIHFHMLTVISFTPVTKSILAEYLKELNFHRKRGKGGRHNYNLSLTSKAKTEDSSVNPKKVEELIAERNFLLDAKYFPQSVAS